MCVCVFLYYSKSAYKSIKQKHYLLHLEQSENEVIYKINRKENINVHLL